MNSKFTILFFSLAFVFFISCHKYSDNPVVPVNKYHFSIGQVCERMLLYSFQDSLLIYAFPHTSETANLDVDRDGLDDFSFTSFITISPGGINDQGAQFEVLNDVFEFTVQTLFDTNFCCRDTVFYENDTIINSVFYSHDTLYSCPSENEFYINGIFENLYVQLLRSGDTLTGSEEWKQSKVDFSNANFSSFYSFEGNIIYANSWKIIHSPWIQEGRKYLLFRKNIENNYLYGWIELEVIDYHGICIYQTAIESY